ncbi:hypothetical protein PR002_g32472, partial [Phytophthora rubi]
MPVLVAGLVLCCSCQLPAWSVGAGASSRLGLLVPELVAGLMAMPGAGLVCRCRCQLPAWSVFAGTSCRLSLFMPVPAAGLVSVLA